MAYVANTMFEVTVSNSVNNQTQNIPGKFGTGTGAEFTGADCSAGWLCTKNGLIPSEGYESLANPILNGNTWYFNAASDGTSATTGTYGDHTGIYAFNSYDVARAVSTDGNNIYNVGFNTLGLGLPADERGDFCEIIIGEQYTFGAGNFSTAPTASNIYCTISAGQLVAAAAAPTGDGTVYFEVLRTKPVNEGSSYWGTGYVLVAKRAAEAASA